MANEELINAGDLQNWVTYQVKQFSGVKDIHGKDAFVWVDTVSRWAALKTIGARESATTDRLKIVASHFILCRFIPGADAQGRFRFGTRFFNISYVNDVNERNQRHEIYVSETMNP